MKTVNISDLYGVVDDAGRIVDLCPDDRAMNLVRAVTNPVTGGIKNLALGSTDVFMAKRQPGNIGMRVFGGRMENPFNDGGTAKTHHVVMTTAVHFDAVQVILAAANAAQVPITKLSVAPLDSAADLNGNSATWTAATFSGSASGNIPARASSRRRKYLVSDLITVSSLDRVDGGTFPLIAIRAYLGTAGTYTMLGNSTASDNLAAWASHPSGRIHVMRYADGDCIATPASFGDTTNRNTSPIVGVIYYARGKVVNVCGFGDSITEGRGTYIGEGFGFPACHELSSSDVAFEWSDFGWAGSDQVNAYGNHSHQLEDAVATGLPVDVAVFCNAGPNGFTPPITSAAITTDGYQHVAKMMALCAQNRIAPVMWTWLPTNPASKDYNASDSLRVAFNQSTVSAYESQSIICDFSSALSGSVDGDGQVNMISGSTTDNIHPNDAGNAILSPLLKSGLSRIF